MLRLAPPDSHPCSKGPERPRYKLLSSAGLVFEKHVFEEHFCVALLYRQKHLTLIKHNVEYGTKTLFGRLKQFRGCTEVLMHLLVQ